MHYKTLVVVHTDDAVADLDAVVEQIMEDGRNEHWDWHQIGGRWTGAFDGYKPAEDPENTEVCAQCQGTGQRNDELGRQAREQDPTYTCNGCQGKGKRPKWPTEWRRHAGDVIPIAKLTDKIYADSWHYVVLSEHGFFSSERYEPWREHGSKFPKTTLPPLEWLKSEYAEGVAIVVDCHN